MQYEVKTLHKVGVHSSLYLPDDFTKMDGLDSPSELMAGFEPSTALLV